MPLEPGARLGPYEIVELRGKGGMGEVYRARDERLDRQVAVKVLPRELSEDPELKKRFEREAKAISRVQHPHVCTLHDFGSDEGVDYLVMEYLEGETLENRLRGGPLPVAEVLRIGRQVAGAVGAAHEGGVVHRDLKPGNVMLTKRGAKVLDFGLAKGGSAAGAPLDSQTPTATALTTAGSLLGTLPYMAPEQLEGKAADERSDVWALGCLLYEMATGERPFRGATQASLIGAILHGHAEPLSQREPAAPERLEQIVARCLEKDPAQRWQTARDVGLELEAAEKASAPSGGASQSVTSRARSAWRSRPILVAAAALAAVALGWWASLETASLEDPVPARSSARGSDPLRLIVVPFENLGPPEQGAFAIGLADEIATGLSRLPGLEVISRTSARRYAGGEKTIPQMGEELGVAYALEGSVEYASGESGGERIRIRPTLVRIADQTRIWSHTYDRVLDDVFEIQSEIALEVSDWLDLTILGKGSERPIPTESMKAYNAYLRGLEADGRYDFDSEAIAVAERMYRLATELDPGFALAWARLAYAHANLYFWGDRTPERKAAAEHALGRAEALAPGLPESHRARGLYYAGVTRQPRKAYTELEIARRDLPNDSHLLSLMAFVRQQQGDWTEGLELRERALRLDPRNSTLMLDQVWTLGNMRRYEEADALAREVLGLEPDRGRAYVMRGQYLALWKGCGAAADLDVPRRGFESWHARIAHCRGRYSEALDLIDDMASDVIADSNVYLPNSLRRAWNYAAMGREERAREEYENALTIVEQALEAMPDDDRVHAALGLIYAGLGRKNEALGHGGRARDLLMAPSRNEVQGPLRLLDLARIQARVGEHEAALDSLEELLTVPAFFSVHSLEGLPDFDPLRELPRYRELVARFSADVAWPPPV